MKDLRGVARDVIDGASDRTEVLTMRWSPKQMERLIYEALSQIREEALEEAAQKVEEDINRQMPGSLIYQYLKGKAIAIRQLKGEKNV